MKPFRKITMDREIFDALSSQSRIDILKALDERQKTVTELSKEQGMAKSTLHEHLARLGKAGLVEKRDAGRKWMYYHLTVKGKNILHPHEKTKFFILLGTAFLSLAAGTYRVVGALGRVGETAQQALKDAPMGRARAAEQLQDEPAVALGVLMILAGLTLAAIAWKMWREIG